MDQNSQPVPDRAPKLLREYAREMSGARASTENAVEDYFERVRGVVAPEKLLR